MCLRQEPRGTVIIYTVPKYIYIYLFCGFTYLLFYLFFIAFAFRGEKKKRARGRLPHESIFRLHVDTETHYAAF